MDLIRDSLEPKTLGSYKAARLKVALIKSGDLYPHDKIANELAINTLKSGLKSISY